MQSWVLQALGTEWPEWSHEETIKAKLLFLGYLGEAFAARTGEDGVRMAEYAEGYGGEAQATLLTGMEMVPAPAAALANAMLTPDVPLLFPVVLAAIEQQNRGGQELLAALVAGLETKYRMGEHEMAEVLGSLVGVANACELDTEDGWPLLLGTVLSSGAGAPQTPFARALLAQGLVLAGHLARDEWSPAAGLRAVLPNEWEQALQHTADEPGMNHFLMATEINADQTVARFREQAAAGGVPAPHIEYYIDAVMALEDVCCMPQFFRR